MEKFDELVREDQIIFDEKVKELVDLFIEKADETLKSAKLELIMLKDVNIRKRPLFSDYSSFEWVIVKSYYSMYNLVRGFLSKAGIKTKTHFSTLLAFDVIYVKKKKVNKKYLKFLKDVKKMAKIDESYLDNIYDVRRSRFSAQYNIKSSIVERDAIQCLKKAEKFINDLKGLV